MAPSQALTPVTAPALAKLSASPKVGRSPSVTSIASAGSSSSAYSRAAEDLLDRLAAQAAYSTFHLWSAGNVRVDGRDLTIPPAGAHDLIRVIHSDERFEVVQVTSLDGEDGEDKKLAVRRTSFASPPTNPRLSDAE